MGIAVRQPPPRQKRAGLDQLVDDRTVGVALFTVGFQDFASRQPFWQIGPERSVFQHVVSHRQPVFDADLIVVVAMAGRCVHKPGPGLFGYVIAGQHGHIEIPLAASAPSCPRKGCAQVI